MQEEFGVDAFVGRTKKPVRGQDFGRVVITAKNIPKIRHAKGEILNLIEKRQLMRPPTNNDVKKNGGGWQQQQQNTTVRERIEVPKASQFMKQLDEIRVWMKQLMSTAVELLLFI